MTRVHAVVALTLLLGVALHGAQPPDRSPDRPGRPRAAAVGSDDLALAAPAGRSDNLTADQILGMTRLAVDRIGGMSQYVPADARTVALKANITIPVASGSGIVTDTRVVRAVAILVHEVAPLAKVLITEAAGGWIDPARRDCTFVEAHADTRTADGWQIAGHRATLQDLHQRGIDAELVDLNFDEVDTLYLADGYADTAYILPRTITRADAWINIPVAKPHGSKITACIKNRFGILPGRIYGWGRSSGTSHHAGIKHNPQIIDESLVDILTVEPEDLCVCDMIAGTNGSAFVGEARRNNIIVAGSDAVSTDLVVARTMGFNPDDFEFADLAWQRGLGPRFIERIDIGSSVAVVEPRFTKAGADYGGSEWSQHANYGMGPRRWRLLGPLPREHTFSAAQLRAGATELGDWSEPVFFHHDRIDLDRYFDDPVHCAVYAATTIAMAQSDSVHFWLGSDEGMTVWIDGEQIYHHEGRRRHVLGGERLPGYLAAGEHELLVRVDQGRGRFDFSFNVCEPLDDVRYAGNRYPGVRYGGETTAVAATLKLAALNRWDDGRHQEALHINTIDGVNEPLDVSRSAPDSVLLAPRVPRSLLMLEAAAAIARQQPLLQDQTGMEGLHKLSTWFAYMPFREDWFPEQHPSIERYLHWAGLDYGLSYGFGETDAVRTMKGWIAQGYPAIIGHGDSWWIADGYRQTGSRLEFHYTEPDTAYWETYNGNNWWGRLANGQWVQTPVLSTRRAGAPVQLPALVDTIAGMLLDNALIAEITLDADWGLRHVPVGLAAWDAWVIEWERLPWTREWAEDEWVQDRLYRRRGLNRRVLANMRGLARFFLAATQVETDSLRREQLAAAARGFVRADTAMDSLRALLPDDDDADGVEPAAMDRIHEARTLPRDIRAGVRQALAALARGTGHTLRPAREDPLQRRDQGTHLATWSAHLSKGVYELVIGPSGAETQQFHGREPEDLRVQTLASVPKRPGWILDVERLSGHGMYSVVEQPADSNGWTGRILIDDEWVGYTNTVELAIWAVPDN